MRAGQVRVRFVPSGKVVSVEQGTTLLEAARLAELPLGSSCDGWLICGFCRVQVLESAENLSLPDPYEKKLLNRLDDPSASERMACAARVFGPVSITTTYW